MSSEGQTTMRLGGPNERWEYRVMAMGIDGFFGPNIDIDQLRQYLDQAGDDGWELVNIVPINRGEGRTGELMGILKRKR
jgi:hypothetical protein